MHCIFLEMAVPLFKDIAMLLLHYLCTYAIINNMILLLYMYIYIIN